eukprot:TRINITY_DN10173_c0_g1_i1.p1 TRINITY_DN10173_c0_g1~~TRINITY_DN10173_c0_g1_i1.p1  ORF type:complete len:402 (+),score=74.72 TRINITY_DN10173_c0_g1_i1:63-1208(+)
MTIIRTRVLTLALVTLLALSSSVHSQFYVWKQINFDGTTLPPPRVFAASSYNAPVPPPFDPSDRSGIVVFGGTDSPAFNGTFFNDVWILNVLDTEPDHRGWTELSVYGDVPTARCLSAVAVDNNMVMYLYGGFDGQNWYQDMWSLDLSVVQYPGSQTTWKRVGDITSSPPPMCGMSMVFCPLFQPDTQSLVMFGGGADKRQLYNTTYHYDFQNDQWNVLASGNPYQGPSAREFHGSYCIEFGIPTSMIVFGGYDYGYTYYNDTYYLENGNLKWSNIRSYTPAPDARASFIGAANPQQPIVIIFGGRSNDGFTVYDDAWVLEADKKIWSLVEGQGGGPSARFGSAGGYYNQGSGGLVVFGGADEQGAVFNDLWVLIQNGDSE